MRYYGLHSGRNNVAAQLVRSYNYNKKKTAKSSTRREDKDTDALNELYAKNPMAVVLIGVISVIVVLGMDSGLCLFLLFVLLIGKVLLS